MQDISHVQRLSALLRLTPYQTYILEKNCKKYDFSRLVKRGMVLYCPYLCDDKKRIVEYVARLLFGPRVDLVGPDRLIIQDQRGVRVYSSGFYSARRNGLKYYADPVNNRVARNMFWRTN